MITPADRKTIITLVKAMQEMPDFLRPEPEELMKQIKKEYPLITTREWQEIVADCVIGALRDVLEGKDTECDCALCQEEKAKKKQDEQGAKILDDVLRAGMMICRYNQKGYDLMEAFIDRNEENYKPIDENYTQVMREALAAVIQARDVLAGPLLKLNRLTKKLKARQEATVPQGQ